MRRLEIKRGMQNKNIIINEQNKRKQVFDKKITFININRHLILVRIK